MQLLHFPITLSRVQSLSLILSRKKNMDPKQVKKEHGVLRKRGRPAGKNRVPLSHDERRARNAQYERERRTEMAEAFADLAKAVDCESSITTQNLLVTVVAQLRRTARRKPGRDADSLRRCNESLKSQIAALEQQLKIDPDVGSAMFPSAPRAELPDETHRQQITCSPLPEYSSPERKCSPPLEISSGHEALSEELPGVNRLPVTEGDFTLDSHGLNSPNNEFMHFDEYHPPPSEQLFTEQGQFDLTSYQFADEQVPTPEYRIRPESPEYMLSEPQNFLCQDVSSNQQESPSLLAESERSSIRHDPYLSQPLLLPLSLHDNDTSMANVLISANEVSSTAAFAPQIDFLSTEDLISVYLSS